MITKALLAAYAALVLVAPFAAGFANGDLHVPGQIAAGKGMDAGPIVFATEGMFTNVNSLAVDSGFVFAITDVCLSNGLCLSDAGDAFGAFAWDAGSLPFVGSTEFLYAGITTGGVDAGTGPLQAGSVYVTGVVTSSTVDGGSGLSFFGSLFDNGELWSSGLDAGGNIIFGGAVFSNGQVTAAAVDAGTGLSYFGQIFNVGELWTSGLDAGGNPIFGGSIYANGQVTAPAVDAGKLAWATEIQSTNVDTTGVDAGSGNMFATAYCLPLSGCVTSWDGGASGSSSGGSNQWAQPSALIYQPVDAGIEIIVAAVDAGAGEIFTGGSMYANGSITANGTVTGVSVVQGPSHFANTIGSYAGASATGNLTIEGSVTNQASATATSPFLLVENTNVLDAGNSIEIRNGSANTIAAFDVGGDLYLDGGGKISSGPNGITITGASSGGINMGASNGFITVTAGGLYLTSSGGNIQFKQGNSLAYDQSSNDQDSENGANAMMFRKATVSGAVLAQNFQNGANTIMALGAQGNLWLDGGAEIWSNGLDAGTGWIFANNITLSTAVSAQTVSATTQLVSPLWGDTVTGAAADGLQAVGGVQNQASATATSPFLMIRNLSVIDAGVAVEIRNGSTNMIANFGVNGSLFLDGGAAITAGGLDAGSGNIFTAGVVYGTGELVTAQTGAVAFDVGGTYYIHELSSPAGALQAFTSGAFLTNWDFDVGRHYQSQSGGGTPAFILGSSNYMYGPDAGATLLACATAGTTACSYIMGTDSAGTVTFAWDGGAGAGAGVTNGTILAQINFSAVFPDAGYSVTCTPNPTEGPLNGSRIGFCSAMTYGCYPNGNTGFYIVAGSNANIGPAIFYDGGPADVGSCSVNYHVIGWSG